jgi:endonuclease YncB( thermonuclease family)
MPKRLKPWYFAIAAIASAIVAALPACPMHDAAGRPIWRVETVHDGDTITCLDTEGRRVRVRLVRIDAPELDQPKGRESRAALVAKLAGGIVRVEGDARDQHGRVLGTLRLDDRNLNREMVAEGWAWAFTGFAEDDDLIAAESAARRARRGLWADPQPMPPRQWRELHPPHSAPGSH